MFLHFLTSWQDYHCVHGLKKKQNDVVIKHKKKTKILYIYTFHKSGSKKVGQNMTSLIVSQITHAIKSYLDNSTQPPPTRTITILLGKIRQYTNLGCSSPNQYFPASPGTILTFIRKGLSFTIKPS